MSSSEENRQERSETPGISMDSAAPVVSGAHRKSGVIWTTEARNDMFARREANESWESICRDYPARSRHAMQQQYSMMKKQKMMAEGTWTTNRRGRKRKQPVPGILASFPRRESGMDDTEADMSVTPSDFEVDDMEEMGADDMDVGTPGPEPNGPAVGGVQGVLDFNRDPRVTGRPSPLSRSATDPAPAPAPAARGRGGGRGRGGRIPSAYGTPENGPPPPLAPKSFTPINAAEPAPIKPNKRPLHDSASLSPAAKRAKPMQDVAPVESETAEVEVPPPFSVPSVLFSQEQLADFFRAGVENAEIAKKSMESADTQRDQATHDAVARANRRVREYEDRLKENAYRHRADIRGIEEVANERVRSEKQKYEDQIRDLELRLVMTRSKIPNDAKDPANGTQDGSLNADAAPTSELMTLVGALEDLKPRYEAEQQRRKKAEARVTTLEQQVAAPPPPASTRPSIDAVAYFRQLESLLKSLEAEASDLSPRALRERLADANAQCARVAGSFMPESQPLPAVQQGPYVPGPHVPGPPHVIAPYQPLAHNASLAPHSIHRPLPHSASPSPIPDRPAMGPSPTSQPMLPSSLDAPYDSSSVIEQKRTHAVSIKDLMNQEPPRSASSHNILPPMNLPPRQSTPLGHPPPHPMPNSQHSLPSAPSPVPGHE